MVQDEVAKRLAAEPSTKDYGALSVISQYYANISYLFQVPPHAFSPAPKVHSAVIQMNMKNTRQLDLKAEPQFNQFIYQCFKQKRKTLVNNLQATYPEAKEILLDYFSDHGLNLQSRAEALNLNHLITLFKKITMDG
jgi:16S rRNA (adenine1518-N6/adenine1519-N6)-dimethyltransferase